MIDIEQVPPERAMHVERRQALREVLMAEVRRSRPWWRRSRQAATVGVGAIALVFVGGAATAYVAFQPATDKYSVVCYSEPRTGEDVVTTRVAVGTSESGTAADQAGTVDDPVQACADLWKQGVLGDQVANPDQVGPTAGKPVVPNLVSCTMEDGTAAVFPGGADVCRGLGVPQTGTAPD